ncbi:MAG: polymer-forming cytoskeletal protein [Rhodobacteraceae bacterium]|nr:polymer-forming cytoskeletal protein [Paracoccaceae bacterium]
MFSKASNNNRGREQAEVRTEGTKSVPSIVSADLSVEGDMVSNGEIQVDGTVTGDIRCKALIVGVKGSVIGEVVAQTVRMHGSIKGMVRAKSVFLASTARMSGDVEHESLAIEPGAFMEGHCRRISDANLASVSDARAARGDSAVQTPRIAPAAASKPAVAAAT